MPRILIVECMQEISSFNPLQSGYDHFSVQRGEELYRQASLNSAVGGALAVFRDASGVAIVPAYSARAGSAGLLSAAGWKCLSRGVRGFRGRQPRRYRRHLCLAAWRHGCRRRVGSGRIFAGPNPPVGRAADADRHLARSARHPDRSDAAPDRWT